MTAFIQPVSTYKKMFTTCIYYIEFAIKETFLTALENDCTQKINLNRNYGMQLTHHLFQPRRGPQTVGYLKLFHGT